MNIFVTGATGFVGKALVDCLALSPALHVAAAIRHVGVKYPTGIDCVEVGSISCNTCWEKHLNSIDAIIHCAARAHIMNDDEEAPLEVYREVNTAGTLNLARQAAAAGVKRFVFISSIKVNGESTTASTVFTEDDAVSTDDPYAVSKAEAEEGLKLIAKETDMEVVIIRPPLVYGLGVKANFLNLMKLASTAAPLPFGAVNNKRSMIYVANLVDFIVQCVEHPAAANQVFLISDGRDLSLRDLLTQLRIAMGKSARLIPIPVFLFSVAGKLLGKQMLVDRLVGDLQVDPSKARDLLAWTPPFTVEQGIQATVDAFLKGRR